MFFNSTMAKAISSKFQFSSCKTVIKRIYIIYSTAKSYQPAQATYSGERPKFMDRMSKTFGGKFISLDIVVCLDRNEVAFVTQQ